MNKLLLLLIFSTFLLSCTTSYSQRYQPSGEFLQYATSDYQFNAYCDEQWHSSRCDDKLYSYVKIKQIDFPVDYRTKHRECSFQVIQNSGVQTPIFGQ